MGFGPMVGEDAPVKVKAVSSCQLQGVLGTLGLQF